MVILRPTTTGLTTDTSARIAPSSRKRLTRRTQVGVVLATRSASSAIESRLSCCITRRDPPSRSSRSSGVSCRRAGFIFAIGMGFLSQFRAEFARSDPPIPLHISKNISAALAFHFRRRNPPGRTPVPSHRETAANRLPSPTALPALPDIEDAAARIRPFVPETPLVRAAALCRQLEAEIWLKVETITPIASYKLRGALNHLLVTTARRPCALAVTSSTGNHGQGVACAAEMLSIPATIFVPVGAVDIKKSMIRLFGATVIEIGHDLDEFKDTARRHAAERKGCFVDDGESFEMIAGAGTLGLEICGQLPDIDRTDLPMGSATMASGVAIAVHGRQPRAEVVAVQSTGAPAMVESFRERRAIERPVDTLADCLVCRVPAVRALHGLIHNVTDCRLVSDELLLSAMHTLLVWAHVLVEPGAAAGLAAAWQDREEIRDAVS